MVTYFNNVVPSVHLMFFPSKHLLTLYTMTPNLLYLIHQLKKKIQHASSIIEKGHVLRLNMLMS